MEPAQQASSTTTPQIHRPDRSSHQRNTCTMDNSANPLENTQSSTGTNHTSLDRRIATYRAKAPRRATRFCLVRLEGSHQGAERALRHVQDWGERQDHQCDDSPCRWILKGGSHPKSLGKGQTEDGIHQRAHAQHKDKPTVRPSRIREPWPTVSFAPSVSARFDEPGFPQSIPESGSLGTEPTRRATPPLPREGHARGVPKDGQERIALHGATAFQRPYSWLRYTVPTAPRTA